MGKAFPNRWAEALSSAVSLPELALLREKSLGTTPWDHRGPSVRVSAGHPEKVAPQSWQRSSCGFHEGPEDLALHRRGPWRPSPALGCSPTPGGH